MEEILELIKEIRGNITTCCAITMEPDLVEDLIDQLEQKIKDERSN